MVLLDHSEDSHESPKWVRNADTSDPPLSVRQQDIRSLQQDLHSIGLSSLGVLEAQVLATLNAVIGNLEALAGARPSDAPPPPVDFQTGPLLLRDHTRRLLGPMPRHRSVRVMVTMPSEAASNAGLIEALLRRLSVSEI